VQTPQDKPLAIVRSYRELMAVLRVRAEEMSISGATLESAAGMPAGYTPKLLADNPIKSLGPKTLGALLGILQLELAVRPRCSSDAAFNAIREDLRKRRVDAQVRHRRKRA
jgi:hypothetical protein